ncbi:MAG: GNAT family N-acetyltransferase [Solirubrobacteraceae bacterium]
MRAIGSGRPGGRIVLPADPLIDGETALRPWRDGDVAALVDACQDPEIARWTRVPTPYVESDARAYLLARTDETFAGLSAPFAVVHADGGAVLGSISLMRFAWQHARGEVGYWLAGEARGRGHATRAVRLICTWGCDALGLERFDLLAATGNQPSQQVAHRAGFTREAVLRSYLQGTFERQDMVAFGLLADDPSA